jgi:hypothetical protein
MTCVQQRYSIQLYGNLLGVYDEQAMDVQQVGVANGWMGASAVT